MVESLILDKLFDFQFVAYAAIFFGMMVEGEAVLFAGVFLANTGYLELSYVVIFALIGMVLGDLLWYWLGASLARFIPKKIVQGVLQVIDDHLKRRAFATIFLAKFIYFLHRLVLVRAKPAGVSFKTFLKADVMAATTWVIIVSVLGFLFSASFYLLKQYIRYAEIGLLIGIIVLVTAEHYTGKYLRKKLTSL